MYKNNRTYLPQQIKPKPQYIMYISKATKHCVIFASIVSLTIKNPLKTFLLLLLLQFAFTQKATAYEPLALQSANFYKEGVPVSEYLVSEKLDGVRAYWNGKNLVSKSGQIIRTPKGYTQDFPKEHLEGELWTTRGQFDLISAASRQKAPEEEIWSKIKLMVFDMPQHKGTFQERLNAMEKIIANTKSKNIQLIKQFKVANHASLMQKLKEITDNGGEGLILHKASSIYQPVRNNDLLKLKPYQDDDAIVITILEGSGKFKGMMGSLVVENHEGQKFKIGTGFTVEERKAPPKIGSTIAYKFHGYTKTGKPKYPSFLKLKH